EASDRAGIVLDVQPGAGSDLDRRALGVGEQLPPLLPHPGLFRPLADGVVQGREQTTHHGSPPPTRCSRVSRPGRPDKTRRVGPRRQPFPLLTTSPTVVNAGCKLFARRLAEITRPFGTFRENVSFTRPTEQCAWRIARFAAAMRF